MKTQQYAVIAFLVLLIGSLTFANADEEQKQIDVLLSDAALFDKAMACHRLAVIGAARSVDTLL